MPADWDDLKAMTEAEIDAELRAAFIDPEALAPRLAERLVERLKAEGMVPPAWAVEHAKRPPRIHLTNWASRNLHRGNRYTIMCRPRRWEHGQGTVQTLTPKVEDLDGFRSGRVSLVEYERRYRNKVGARSNLARLAPGYLTAHRYEGDDDRSIRVRTGDTLCCACSRADAAEGRCHRVWAAEYLREAGWVVVLDGEVTP